MKPPLHRRVVATGMGALSPAGPGVEAYLGWRAAPGAHDRIPEFEAARYIPNPKLLRSMHRTFQVVAAAAVLAMRDAGLPKAGNLPAAGVAPARAGLAAALADVSPLTADLLRVLRQACTEPEGRISWSQFAELSLHELHPFRRLTLLANMASAHTSLLFGLQGPSFTFTSGGPAGAQAVAQAYYTVASGRADLMLCQAADSPEQAFLSRPRPETGAGLVLEEWESAARRGAPLLAEILPPLTPPRLRQADCIDLSPASGLLHALVQLRTVTHPSDRHPAGIPLDQLLAPGAIAANLERAS